MRFLKKVFWNTSKFFFHLIPLPYKLKEPFKMKFFMQFKKLFNAIKGFEIRTYHDAEKISLEELILENKNKHIKYIPYKENASFENTEIKFLAFYLPQFHAIPENNKWWGEGFTEWTNVKPAKPLFEGHYQPHIPVESGYYNLLDTEVQKHQVALAKNYGISGFCFHFYWFQGKTLLEKPIENYLQNTELDFPYCLSWANETWSRRWDGMENEILIKQNHSAEDDIAFISYISKYMKDKRYIRINNKPLLLVYRPALFPSPKKTMQRWRKWCLENGIGEIYLAYVQSFEKFQPNNIGFDAAVEFPPNCHFHKKLIYTSDFYKNTLKCNIHDWNELAVNSENFKPNYKLFRGVCPSWDNTPRRKNESTVFFNSHPEFFKNWLYSVSIDTIRKFNDKDERLVFINAWNEWAEGAHLEPDEKYGYAYLQMVYEVIQELSSFEKNDLEPK